MHMVLEPQIFTGSGTKEFSQRVCDYLGTSLGETTVITFEEGNTYVNFGPSVRDKEVYLVQSISGHPNDDFVEMLFWVDAFKRSSASSVTVVMPHFSYSKADKKDEPHVSIRARVCADCLEAVGVDRVITMDLHSPQVQGFFRIPVDNLHALPVFCKCIERMGLNNPVVVSPDAGGAKNARKFAERLGASVAIGDKLRRDHSEQAEVLEIIGDVKGRDALIVDDFTLTCGTLADTAKALRQNGAARIIACVTHGVLRERGLTRLRDSDIETLIVTDSIGSTKTLKDPKIKVISVAPVFAEAIMRIHNRQGVSELFDSVADSVVDECIKSTNCV